MVTFFRRRSLHAAAIAAAAVSGLVFASAPAEAGSVTGTIGVTLNISGACAINGGTATSGALGQLGAIAFADQPGVFGDVNGSMVATGGTNALSILCSPGLTPSLQIGAGAHDSGAFHYLAAGTNQVAYHLYSDPARTNEITIGQSIPLGNATTTAFQLPLYAKVNSGGAALAAGAYSDTVQVTLSW